MAKCLVLGANGFIGSHLVDALSEKGHQVRAFGHFGDKVIFDAVNVDIFKGDFLNRGDLASAVEGVDYVFHFISTTTPASAEKDPIVDISTNISMSVELFKLCVESKVKKVIFASSGGSIYGDSGNQPHSETDPTLPVSPYAIAKLTIENYLRFFKVVHGLDSVSFRVSNPYGERQPFHRKQGVIPIFLENICRDIPITVMGDGSMSRDYIYVRDLASIVAEVFDKESAHDVYNLGTGMGTTLNAIIKVIHEVTGIDPVVEYAKTPLSYVDNVSLSMDRFIEDYGIIPVTNLKEGIANTYNYIRSEVEHED